jgi:hypothetical protein
LFFIVGSIVLTGILYGIGYIVSPDVAPVIEDYDVYNHNKYSIEHPSNWNISKDGASIVFMDGSESSNFGEKGIWNSIVYVNYIDNIGAKLSDSVEKEYQIDDIKTWCDSVVCSDLKIIKQYPPTITNQGYPIISTEYEAVVFYPSISGYEQLAEPYVRQIGVLSYIYIGDDMLSVDTMSDYDMYKSHEKLLFHMMYSVKTPVYIQTTDSIQLPTIDRADEPLRELRESINMAQENTITWAIGHVPSVPNTQIPDDGVRLAVQTWQEYNPNLTFIYDSNEPDFEIYYKPYESELGHDTVGLAECYYDEFNMPYDCVVDIALGNYDCNGDYIQHDTEYVADTTMHEIGHVLGIGHATDETHLMWGDDGKHALNTLGYNIPVPFDGFYVGYNELLDEYNEIYDDHYELLTVFEKEESLLIMESKRLNDRLYDLENNIGIRSSNIQFEYDRLNRDIDVYNTRIDKQDTKVWQSEILLNQMEKIGREMACYPGVPPYDEWPQD